MYVSLKLYELCYVKKILKLCLDNFLKRENFMRNFLLLFFYSTTQIHLLSAKSIYLINGKFGYKSII